MRKMLIKKAGVSLSNKQMQATKGGCGCGCFWVNQGGSSSIDNGCKNADSGLTSKCPPGKEGGCC